MKKPPPTPPRGPGETLCGRYLKRSQTGQEVKNDLFFCVRFSENLAGIE
jgi:hypothetical protein